MHYSCQMIVLFYYYIIRDDDGAELVTMMVMQICVAHRRSIQLYTVCEDRVIALKDVSVAESPLTLVILT